MSLPQTQRMLQGGNENSHNAKHMLTHTHTHRHTHIPYPSGGCYIRKRPSLFHGCFATLLHVANTHTHTHTHTHRAYFLQRAYMSVCTHTHTHTHTHTGLTSCRGHACPRTHWRAGACILT